MTGPLLITGFHRSGTSAVARVLHRAGLDLGDDLLGAEPSNPHGHYEDVTVIAAHDAALAAHDLTWKDAAPCPLPSTTLRSDIAAFVSSRSHSALWGVKDPRMCLFLGEWLAAIPHARVLVVARRPGAAIASLHRRHVRRSVDTRRVDATDLNFWKDPDLGLRLWIHYHEQLLAFLPKDSVVVDFDNRSTIEQLPSMLRQRWGLPFVSVDANRLDPELGGAGDAIEVRDLALLALAQETWAKLPILT